MCSCLGLFLLRQVFGPSDVLFLLPEVAVPFTGSSITWRRLVDDPNSVISIGTGIKAIATTYWKTLKIVNPTAQLLSCDGVAAAKSAIGEPALIGAGILTSAAGEAGTGVVGATATAAAGPAGLGLSLYGGYVYVASNTFCKE